MIPVSIRLRRAIHLNDLSLVKRIVKNNPKYLQNPDFDDNGNTSLHLAARLALLEITEFLIDAGHEHHCISRNFTLSTPLHLSISSPSPSPAATSVSTLLATRFPTSIALPDIHGATSLHLCARTPHAALLPTLLHLTTANPQALLEARDKDGNTALHYASAWGQLKCVRGLLERGASAGARNEWSWTPVSYSCSVQAEVYFRGLVGEGVGQGRGRKGEGGRERGGGGGGVRLVEGDGGDVGGW